MTRGSDCWLMITIQLKSCRKYSATKTTHIHLWCVYIKFHILSYLNQTHTVLKKLIKSCIYGVSRKCVRYESRW